MTECLEFCIVLLSGSGLPLIYSREQLFFRKDRGTTWNVSSGFKAQPSTLRLEPCQQSYARVVGRASESL